MFDKFFGQTRRLSVVLAAVAVLSAAAFLAWRGWESEKTQVSKNPLPTLAPSEPQGTPEPGEPSFSVLPPSKGEVPPYRGEPAAELKADPNFLKQVSGDRYQKSLDDLKDLSAKLAQNPNQPDLWKGVAYIKHFYNDYGGVRDAYEYLNVIADIDPIPFYNLANLYGYDLKQPDKAAPKYKEAINLDPLNTVYYIGFANFYQDVFKDMKSSEEVLLAGEKKLPNEPAIAVALGALYENMGRADESIARYEKALKIGGYTKGEVEAIQRAIERVKNQKPL